MSEEPVDMEKLKEVLDRADAVSREIAACVSVSEDRLRASVPDGITIVTEEEVQAVAAPCIPVGELYRFVTLKSYGDVDEPEKLAPTIDKVLEELRAGLDRCARAGAACFLPYLYVKVEAYLIEIFAYTTVFTGATAAALRVDAPWGASHE